MFRRFHQCYKGKLYLIYNNAQRAHTTISRAERIMVCQTGFEIDLQSAVVYNMENTRQTMVKSVTTKKEQMEQYEGSSKQLRQSKKYDPKRKTISKVACPEMGIDYREKRSARRNPWEI